MAITSLSVNFCDSICEKKEKRKEKSQNNRKEEEEKKNKQVNEQQDLMQLNHMQFHNHPRSVPTVEFCSSTLMHLPKQLPCMCQQEQSLVQFPAFPCMSLLHSLLFQIFHEAVISLVLLLMLLFLLGLEMENVSFH